MSIKSGRVILKAPGIRTTASRAYMAAGFQFPKNMADPNRKMADGMMISEPEQINPPKSLKSKTIA